MITASNQVAAVSADFVPNLEVSQRLTGSDKPCRLQEGVGVTESMVFRTGLVDEGEDVDRAMRYTTVTGESHRRCD